MNRLWLPALAVPAVLVLLAMAPQGPQDDPAAKTDLAQVVSLSQLQYVDSVGKSIAVPARSMLEVRLLEDFQHGLRFEIYYENGDYSLVDAQAMHLVRAGQDVQEVRFVRSRLARMKYPLMR